MGMESGIFADSRPPIEDPLMDCPSGKVRYSNKVRALLAIVKIEEKGPREIGGHIPKRVYRCLICKKWHLTSQDQREPESV